MKGFDIKKWKNSLSSEKAVMIGLSVALVISLIFNIVFLVNNKNDRDTVEEVVTLTDQGSPVGNINSEQNDKAEFVTDWLNNEDIGEFYDFVYIPEENMIRMHMTTNGMIQEFLNTMEGKISAREWDDFFDSLDDLSEVISRKTADKDIRLGVMSPFEENVGIYVTRNGVEEFHGFNSIGLK